jgi:uncharacterized protein (DUF111 family)
VDRLSTLIFQETTTIGLRRYARAADNARPKVRRRETEYGVVRMKVSKMNGEVVNFTPEFEDCARVARREERFAEASAGVGGCSVFKFLTKPL